MARTTRKCSSKCYGKSILSLIMVAVVGWIVHTVLYVGMVILPSAPPRVVINSISPPQSSLRQHEKSSRTTAADAKMSMNRKAKQVKHHVVEVSNISVPQYQRAETDNHHAAANAKVEHGRDRRRDATSSKGMENIMTDLTTNHTASSSKNDSPLYIHTKEGSKSCTCDFVSVDCLDSIHCMPQRQSTSYRYIAQGILLRKLIKQTAEFQGEANIEASCPMGKGLQYKTINAWISWTEHNQLPQQHEPMPEYLFVNSSRYTYCQEHGLVGLLCYFTPNSDAEEYEDDLEKKALPYVNELENKNTSKRELMHYLRDIQRRIRAGIMNKDGGVEEKKMDGIHYLTGMAHILRIQFNRQETLVRITNNNNAAVTFNAQKAEKKMKTHKVTPPLRVSLHLRRADSCMANPTYVKEASPLHSSAQQFNNRICYETSVYMDALRRVQSMVHNMDPSRHIEVYISSDDSSELLEEIRTKFSDLYHAMTWHFHGTNRSALKYTDFVEDRESHDNHDKLGESAVADIWLLSHGEVFIGHLGSRFGKVAYLLATARLNRFIPFFSVDGHSYCCEIDEPCGEMKPYITSMTDCLTFAHDRVDVGSNEMNDNYFEVGSFMRKMLAEKKAESIKTETHADDTNADAAPSKNGKEESKGKTQDEDKNPWADLSAPIANWDYFPQTRSKQSVEEPVIELDPSKCSNLPLDTSPPKQYPPSNGACNGFDGVLHIQQGDVGGATGTIFFIFVIGMLQYADQHNLKPWVHLNSWSRVVYDPIVHGQGNATAFTMLEGKKVTWARDKRDPEGNLFPGLPKVGDREKLHPREFVVDGSGVWDHYFVPVSDFVPGDPSCQDKPFITLDSDHIAPGLHSQAPWSPRAWRLTFIDYIERRDLQFDKWIEPIRRQAAAIVKKYIRLNQDMLQRVECAHPQQENSLGLHIRHGDKGSTRGGEIAVKDFLPYAAAFVKHGGGKIFVATDSSLVFEEIKTEWPKDIRSHVIHQHGVKGLSHNDTAAFDLGVSPHRTNVEALVDLIALSKCTYIVHGFSALSEASLYLNPGLMERSVNLEHDEQARREKYHNFVSMISKGGKGGSAN